MKMRSTVPQIYDLKGRYERLSTDRYVFLERARSCAEITIPTLIPPLGHNKTTKYYTPWQGVGARGVNTLASKLLLALFPPNSPFFRLVVDEFAKEEMAGDEKMASLIDAGLAKVERAMQSEIESGGYRTPGFLAIKHLIVGGNTFCVLPKEGGMRVFCLDSYVAQRDSYGNLLDAITLEKVNKETLPENVEALLEEETKLEAKQDEELEKKGQSDDANSADLEIYTRYYRDGDMWNTYQEICGKRIPGSEGSWPLDKPGFLCLRWSHVEGEDYGRSYVEEYLGDLISLEGLSKSIVEAAAAAAKVVFLVNPNGVTKAKAITEANSGDAIVGRADDVHALQTEKQADLTIAQKTVETINQRLAYAFLMNSAIQRNGERVTAEEIRYMASELEDALGGVYSILSQEFQLPFISRIMDAMTKAKRIPKLPKGVVKTSIVTGLEALGRGHDADKLRQFIADAQPLIQLAANPAVAQFININEALNRLCTARGIDPAGLIPSMAEVQQQQQQAQEQQQQSQMTEMAGKAAPAAIKAMSDQVKAAGEQQPPTQG
jgi:hypothetical protein